VAAEATKGIATMSLKYQKPVSFGRLTTDTIEQARENALQATKFVSGKVNFRTDIGSEFLIQKRIDLINSFQ
jgi:6,7-dimethyl-8-ribityllumazine synthase